ncbi:MAG: hypothetical protein NC041_01595 [Bacteroides sp.]|nr:hypothetical protein [Treponema brennaborense]MCM1469147.1 hypothetical protein [Bacteroides sp.]
MIAERRSENFAHGTKKLKNKRIFCAADCGQRRQNARGITRRQLGARAVTHEY